MDAELVVPNWLDTDSEFAYMLGNRRYQALLEQLYARVNDGESLPEWFTSTEEPNWLLDFIENLSGDSAYSWLLDLWIDQKFISEVDPVWALELRDKFEALIAHQFVLHFNVTDYVFDARYGFHMRLPEYLVRRYPDTERDVFFYNRSQGVTPASERLVENRVEREHNNRFGSFLERLTGLGFNTQNNRILMNPAEALYGLEQHLYATDRHNSVDTNSVVVFEFAEKVAPTGGIEFQGGNADLLIQIETLQRWALDARMRDRRHLILLLARNIAEVSENLREANSGTEAIEVPMPDDSARLKYISYLFYSYAFPHQQQNGRREIRFDEHDFPIDPNSNVPALRQQMEIFAAQAAGLTRVAMQDIVLRAFQMHKPITARLVQERKETAIRSESRNLLEIVKTDQSMDAAGGLEHIKTFLRSEVVKPLKDRRSTTPAGVLFLGPPGTGKTLLAEGLANESGVNFVKLGNFRDQFVGQSERNLSHALNIIRAMTPVIVFMDELDQSEGRRSEGNLDSGVGSRVFAKLLEVMSDASLRGKVVWIAASNRPDLIDDAMRRPGRFDDKIPFLMPTEAERASIFQAVLRYKSQINEVVLRQIDLRQLAVNSKGYSGAEIEVVVSRAVRRAEDEKRVLETGDLEDALSRFIHSVNQSKYRLMTLLALAEVNDSELITNLKQRDDIDSEWYSTDTKGELRLNQGEIQKAIRQLRQAIQ